MELIRIKEDDADIPKLRAMMEESEFLSVKDEYFPFVTTSPKEAFYKIVADGETIGGIQCETHGSITYMAVIIEKSRRRHGYAERAIAALIEVLPKTITTIKVSIDKSNAPSIALFEKLGFCHTGREEEGLITMCRYGFITLREKPELIDTAAGWFHSKWSVPKEAYYECMEAYLSGETEYGWYLCLDGDKIVGGLGVIANDFHDRPDLTPNVCAVYTEPEYRNQGIAGRLLDLVVSDCKAHGIEPLYLLTDHTGFYERYGWEFLCMVQPLGEPDKSRMYIHR